MAADIEAKCSKIHRSRDSFKVPPNEESFVRREVLSKIVDRSFQLGRPVGEQDHLCFFREASEVSRTRWSPHHRFDSIAGGRQCRNTGSANEPQKSPPVHQVTSIPTMFADAPMMLSTAASETLKPQSGNSSATSAFVHPQTKGRNLNGSESITQTCDGNRSSNVRLLKIGGLIENQIASVHKVAKVRNRGLQKECWWKVPVVMLRTASCGPTARFGTFVPWVSVSSTTGNV